MAQAITNFNDFFACNAKRENGKIMLDGMSFESVKDLLQYCEENDVIIKTVEADRSVDCWDELNMLKHQVAVGASDLSWIGKQLTEQREEFWKDPSAK